MDNPEIELPPNRLGKLDVGGAVGSEGFLYVLRDVGYGYPYSSTIELVSGEIGDDLTHYLVTSEQTPSALVLGVFVDSVGVQAAGGILLQVLPKAATDEELVRTLESRIGSLSGFTPLLRQRQTLPEIFEHLIGDMGLRILPETQLVRFQCSCSLERVLGALKLFGVEELQDMILTDGGAEAKCEFCSEVYQATPDHLNQLIKDLQQDTGSAPRVRQASILF